LFVPAGMPAPRAPALGRATRVRLREARRVEATRPGHRIAQQGGRPHDMRHVTPRAAQQPGIPCSRIGPGAGRHRNPPQFGGNASPVCAIRAANSSTCPKSESESNPRSSARQKIVMPARRTE